MYNLNISGSAAPGNLLSVSQGENSCTTPRTPEILNSLIAMTNPFDSYHGGTASGPRLASSPPSGSDTSSSSGSPSCMSPPSIQHTCSQLIKEGLKHTLQTKRRNHINSPHHSVGQDKFPKTEDMSQILFDDNDDSMCSTGEGLTPEDEERRRRRRERNKIAATKCRLKKRERTVNLVKESEVLENQNHDLKSQIQELETQRRRLVDMLTVHTPSCTKQTNTSSSNVFSTTHNPTVNNSTGSNYHHMDSGSYSRSSDVAVEETTSVYRVNVSSTMTYRRVEVASDYQRQSTTTQKDNMSNSVYQEEPGSSYNRHNNYHGVASFDEEDVSKESNSVWRSNSGASIDTQYGRVSNTDSGYSCQPSLTGLDSPLPFMPSEDGSPYSRPTSSVFSRPTSLDVSTSDYDSNVEILDSPTIPPPYHHFNESDTFCAGYPPDRGCIS